MRLALDTSVLVGELLRRRGRERLADARLDLFIAEWMREEVDIEIPRRFERFGHARGLGEASVRDLIHTALAAIDRNVVTLPVAVYSAAEDEARSRSGSDPHDWPAVACAIALDAGVWTNDNDFLGAGVPTWTTPTITNWLERHPAGEG